MVKAPFFDYKNFARRRYGETLYRVPIDPGLGCPNRDSQGRGGCTFCSEDGGRARQITGIADLTAQAEAGIRFARQRYRAEKFMLYLQAYTATFSQSSTLENIIRPILEEYDFQALSLGTRPDCLNEEIIKILASLNKTLEVWIELGTQTVHDKTLLHINRGHDWETSRNAILRLAEKGLKVAPHVIIGLPGEDSRHWNETAEKLSKLPISGIKIHNLHVIKNTKMAEEFAVTPSFPVLDEYQYGEALIAFLRKLPPDLPIMRLVTDTPNEKLLAPKWSMSKGRFLAYLTRQMQLRNVRQGDLWKGQNKKDSPPESKFIPLKTDDGSITFWNSFYKEHYHSKIGAFTEARDKFIIPSCLKENLANNDIRLLDICFGLGYNSLAACEIAENTKNGRLQVTALEQDARVISAACEWAGKQNESGFPWSETLLRVSKEGRFEGKSFTLQLLLGDARATVNCPAAVAAAPFDIVFLDAFSTQRNAELWSLDFFRRIKGIMAKRGILITYCAALPVRSGLMQAGFYVGETAPIGRKRGGTIAAIKPEDITTSLPENELEKIRSTPRGIAYRDPSQKGTNRQILRHREELRRNAQMKA